MKICEIFTSIQGESTLQGCPTVFLRLSGCNLNCRYCDTVYAREGGRIMTPASVVATVTHTGLRYACITGGEPLLQEETPELARELLRLGLIVSIETNGTIDASNLPMGVRRIIDIKCPGSGEHGKTHPRLIAERRPTDEYKFVISDRDDFDYACRFVSAHDLSAEHTVLFAPVFGILAPRMLSRWILTEMADVRLNLQLHKYIWPEGPEGSKEM